MAIKHSTTANPNNIVASADWNADHVVDGNTGEVLFLTAGGNVGADSGLFWDNTNKRLGVGTNTPSVKLEINGNMLASNFTANNSVTFVGYETGSGATGAEPILFGYQAGLDSIGDNLNAFGQYAGYESSGSYITAVGYEAGDSSAEEFLVAMGYSAGASSSGNSGVYIGAFSGADAIGDYSIGIGYETVNANTGHNVVAIGYQAGSGNAVANQFILKQNNINVVPLIQGDFSTGNVAIGKTSAGSKLGVAGLPIYANNAAAIVGGLTAGDFYRTNADPDPLMVVH